MSLTKAQAQARAASPQRPGEPITEVSRSKKGFSISTKGSGFWLSREDIGDAAPPKVGDEIVVHTHRGSLIRGIDLRGEPLYYKTDEELDVDQERYRTEYHERQRKEFEKKRRKIDRTFSTLPDVFQRRISWFRAWNPDFRWQYEEYELSACVDAVKIAEAMKTPKGVERFQKMRYATQRKHVPDLYEGHSGNSFGMACRLAWLYVTDPLLVIAEHGALTPLVGCDDYGCAHPRPADVMAVVEERLGT